MEIIPSKRAYISSIVWNMQLIDKPPSKFSAPDWTFIQQWIIRTDKYFLTSLQHKTKIAGITQDEDKGKELCHFVWLLKLLRDKNSLKESYFF